MQGCIAESRDNLYSKLSKHAKFYQLELTYIQTIGKPENAIIQFKRMLDAVKG